jgi:hypothetical protein
MNWHECIGVPDAVEYRVLGTDHKDTKATCNSIVRPQALAVNGPNPTLR